jgi:hypothetical protein
MMLSPHPMHDTALDTIVSRLQWRSDSHAAKVQ